MPVQGNRPAFALQDRESGSAEASGSGARPVPTRNTFEVRSVGSRSGVIPVPGPGNQAEDLVEIEVEVASEGSKTESDPGELYIFDSEPRPELAVPEEVETIVIFQFEPPRTEA